MLLQIRIVHLNTRQGTCRVHCGRRQRRRRMMQAPNAARTPLQQQQHGKQQQQPPQGSVLGSALLVAGTAVGAGVLALPAVTQESGFVASSAALAAGGAYSAATGLLLAELYVNASRGGNDSGSGSSDSGSSDSGDSGSSSNSGTAAFAGIARATLGGAGLAAGAGAYAFLHVALLVAYISKAGETLALLPNAPPAPAASALFTAAFGALVYFAPPPLLDRANGALFAGVVAAFCALLAAAAPSVDLGALARADWAAVPATLPVVALSFVHHNVVPVVCRDLGGDARRVSAAIGGGVAVPVLMFLLWNGAVLGSLDALSDGAGAGAGGRAVVADPLAALAAADGSVGAAVAAFSLLAVATSFIGFVLGLTDFLAAALRLPGAKSPLAYALALGPPLALAWAYPGLFLTAIDAAGTYGVLTLFAILPAAMAWSARYGGGGGGSGGGGSGGGVELVPGGRATLVLIAGGAAAVIANEAAGGLLPLAR